MKAGCIEVIEVDSVYAVQDSTFTTIAYEMLCRVGHFLASRESLWSLLRLYHRVARPLVLKVASVLDHRLQTRWAKVYAYIKLLQKARVPREIYSLACLELNKSSCNT